MNKKTIVALSLLSFCLLNVQAASEDDPQYSRKHITSFEQSLPEGWETAKGLLFVSNFRSNTISVFMVANDGSLTPIGQPTPTGIQPGGATISPDGTYLFVSHRKDFNSDRGSNAISVFRIASNGSLTPIGRPVPTGGQDPQQPTISPDGTYLFVSNRWSDTISVFRIAKDGSLTPIGQPVPTGGIAPQQPTISPDGKHLFVSNSRSNAIPVFRIADDGSLNPVGQSTPTGIGPQTTISPDGKHLFVSNHASNTISVFRIADDGSLTLIGQPVQTGVGPKQPTISPDGTYLFVSNYHNGSVISVFRIADDGSLTPIGRPVPIGGGGREQLTISPDGKHLFVSNHTRSSAFNYEINTISSFTVADDGALTRAPGSPFKAESAPNRPAYVPVPQKWKDAQDARSVSLIEPLGTDLTDIPRQEITQMLFGKDRKLTGEAKTLIKIKKREFNILSFDELLSFLSNEYDPDRILNKKKGTLTPQGFRIVNEWIMEQDNLEMHRNQVNQRLQNETDAKNKSILEAIKDKMTERNVLRQKIIQLLSFLSNEYDPDRIVGGIFHQLLSPFLNVKRGTLTPEGFRIVDEWIMKQDSLEIYRNQIDQRLQNEKNEEARSILRAVKDRIDVQLRSME